MRAKNILKIISLILLTGHSFTAKPQVQQNDTLSGGGLPEVVISALRLPFKESTVPYGVSLLSARTNTQGLSLSENLAALPGLEVNARYNYAVGDRITNRGFGARTQFGVRGIRIVFDDMPVTFADGQSNLEMIDLQNLSYVEFLRGPGSSLYGNASGGVLILHSNEITNNHFLSSVSSAIGSNGLFRWNGSIEGKIGKTSLSATYSDFHYTGFREHATAGYKRAFGKLVSNLSSKNILQFEAGLVKFHSLNPGSLTKQDSEQEPEKANPSSVSNEAGQDGNQVQLSGTWRHIQDSSSQLKLTVYGIHRSVVNPIIGKIVVLPQYSGGITSAYNSEFHLSSKTISWSAGIEIASRFNNRKNYINETGQEGDITINQKEQVICSGLFVQALLRADEKLSFDACIRYDLNYFGVQNHLLPGIENNSGHRFMKALDPSTGFIYRIFKNLRFFANISTSFETPTSTELVNRPDGAGGFNPDLNPSQALEYEAGIRGYISQIITYDLTAYLIRTKNELIPFQIESSPGQDYFRNAGSSLHRGGEITLRIRPVSFLDLNSSLTYVDAFYKTFTIDGVSYSGNKIPGVSRIHVASELKLQSSAGFYLSALMQNFGKMYVNDANSDATTGYTVFDLDLGHNRINIGKKQVKSILISAGISNVFNTHYISAVTVNAAADRYFEPGPGRTFYLNTRFEFGIR